jgi:hypothetical protein
MLALEQVPGAAPVAKSPSPVLDESVWSTASANLVDRHRYVTVAGNLATVMGWVKTHPVPGFLMSSSQIGGSNHVEGWTFTAGTVGRTSLSLVGVQDKSSVDIRIDAQVIWLPAKTAAELIPPSVTKAVVDYTGPTTSFGTPPGGPVTTPKPRHAHRVVSGATLSAIAADLNALPQGTPFTSLSCPMEDGEQARVAVDFGGRHVVFDIEFSGCSSVQVTSNGHQQPYLSLDPALIKDVYAAVGIIETPIPRAPRPGPPVRTKPPAFTVFEHNQVAAQRVADASRDLTPAGASIDEQNSKSPARPPYNGPGRAVDRSMAYSVQGTLDQLVAWYRAHPVPGTVAAEPQPLVNGVRRLVMEPKDRSAPVRALVWVSMVQRGDQVVYRIDAQTVWR